MSWIFTIKYRRFWYFPRRIFNRQFLSIGHALTNQRALPLAAGPINAVHEVQLRRRGGLCHIRARFPPPLSTNQLLTVDRKRQTFHRVDQSARWGEAACALHYPMWRSSVVPRRSHPTRWVKRPINCAYSRGTRRKSRGFMRRVGLLVLSLR